MKPRVFLSHSKVDRNFIEKMAEDLRPGRIDVWYDDWEIPAGASLREKIFSEGIGRCDLFFVYLTNASVQSKWVREEIDVALLTAMEKEGTFLALYVDSDNTRDLLRDDLQIRRIPTINQKNYTFRLLELVSRAWEAAAFRIHDRIIAKVGISGTSYDFNNFFNKHAKDCVVIAQNLRTLISKGFLSHARNILKQGSKLTIILTTYEVMCAISEKAGEHFIESVKELRYFVKTLPLEYSKGLKIHFHPGATSLSAMIRIDSHQNTIVFTPKWATDIDPDSRIFCVIDENQRPDLFSRLVGHISYMTSPGWPNLQEMCKKLKIEWSNAEHSASADG